METKYIKLDTTMGGGTKIQYHWAECAATEEGAIPKSEMPKSYFEEVKRGPKGFEYTEKVYHQHILKSVYDSIPKPPVDTDSAMGGMGH